MLERADSLGQIRPKKECIKSYETCFAKNVLSFLIRSKQEKSLFPKVL